MKCKKCGTEISENEKNCPKCGTEVPVEVSPDIADIAEIPPEPRGFSSKKNLIIIAIAAVLALGGVGAAVAVGASNRVTQSAPGGIQLAERYLSEMKYEQAVIEYQRILEIEPRNVEAYLGLAEAYIGLGNTEKALEILRKGFEITGDQRLQAKIDELTKPPVSSSTVSSSLSSSSSGNTSEPAESSSSSAASSSETESSSTSSATESSVTPSSSSSRPEESSSRPNGSNMQSSVPVVNYSPESDFVVREGELSMYNGNDADVSIPPVINGEKITSINASCFFMARNTVKSVIIPEGVTALNDGHWQMGCFSGCRLVSVTLPDSLQHIGSYAFYDCGLKSITIPAGVTVIGEMAFAGCDLTSLTIPNGVTEIGDFAFSDNTVLESVNIPDSVTKIGSGVFSASYEGGPGCEKVIVTYKGNTYDYEHINDLYNAING